MAKKRKLDDADKVSKRKRKKSKRTLEVTQPPATPGGDFIADVEILDSQTTASSSSTLLPKKTKARAPKTVLVGTTTIYNEKDPAHQNEEIETISYNTFRNRKYNNKLVTVLKGTGIYFDPENSDHEGEETEEVTANVAASRVKNKKRVTVLKGTGIHFNPELPEHEGQETEEVTANVAASRVKNKKLVTVLKGTGIRFNPKLPGHEDQETEEITVHAASGRAYNKKPVTVLIGTGVRYDETVHQDQATEIIPYSTFNNRAYKMRQPTQPPPTPFDVEVLHVSEPSSSSANLPIRVVSSNPNTLFSGSSSIPENPIERRLYRAQEVRQKNAARLQKNKQ